MATEIFDVPERSLVQCDAVHSLFLRKRLVSQMGGQCLESSKTDIVTPVQSLVY